MSEQGLQDSKDIQKADSNAPFPNKPNPHKPDSRADVDPRALVARPRRHLDGKKLRKKNAQGILQYNVSIVSGRYDDQRHSWMYRLNDWEDKQIDGEAEETQLG